MSSELTSSKAGGHRRGPLLVLGAAGQLGTDLVRAAAAAGIECVGLTHQDLDVTDGAAVTAALERIRPAIVVNSTSFTNVEQCEENPLQAYAVNAVGALLVARAAARVGARVVYISTDYVFSGDKPPALDGALTPDTAYVETDPVAPLNVYGASKAAGEQATALATPDHLIVRVSSLFGVAGSRGKGGNFVETIIRKAREGGPLRVVNDQWMTPTYTADAAPAIIRLALSDVIGILHVANAGCCTWHEFAVNAVRLYGIGVDVQPVRASTSPSKVRRPQNSALHTGRLAAFAGVSVRPWRAALAAYVAAKGQVP